ncbi:MAG: hemerythrin domain-containing protein [Thermoleophilia bacterium]|nr:hemerythrin domain-containing protein [Thermoleophilia bacterium]
MQQPPPTSHLAGPEVFASMATPDDGVRLSAEPVWVEADRPTATPAPPDSTYDLQALAIAGHLVDVHDHLRGNLQQIQSLIAQVLQGTMTPGEARSGIYETTLARHSWNLGAYCAQYCSMVTGHHGLEDAVLFPHLRKADAELEPVIDRLEQEHHVIHEVLGKVDAAIVKFDGDRSDVASLQQAMNLLTDALLSHLSYEERELLEPLARHGMFPG